MRHTIAACLLLLLLAGCASQELPLSPAAVQEETPVAESFEDVPEKAGAAADPALAQLLAGLPYECIQLGVGLEEAEIVAAFEEQQDQGSREGYTPVLLLDDDFGVLRDILAGIAENPQAFQAGVQETLDAYGNADTADFFLRREAELEEPMGEWDSAALESDGWERDLLFYQTGLEGQAVVVKLPTEKPYEAVAYLPFAAGGQSPPAELLTAVAKEWYEDLGAVPACISYDTVQFRYPAPLTDPEDVHRVARETFLLDETPWMGVSLQEHANAFIFKSRATYLWWD